MQPQEWLAHKKHLPRLHLLWSRLPFERIFSVQHVVQDLAFHSDGIFCRCCRVHGLTTARAKKDGVWELTIHKSRGIFAMCRLFPEDQDKNTSAKANYPKLYQHEVAQREKGSTSHALRIVPSLEVISGLVIVKWACIRRLAFLEVFFNLRIAFGSLETHTKWSSWMRCTRSMLE